MEQELLTELYSKMLRIRRFEEEAARLYTEKKIGGFLHLYIGQEAVAVGALSVLTERDYVMTAYRCHGHFLARGGSPRAGMAELMGKETGCAKGRGGSMHFYDVERRFMGAGVSLELKFRLPQDSPLQRSTWVATESLSAF